MTVQDLLNLASGVIDMMGLRVVIQAIAIILVAFFVWGKFFRKSE